MDLSVPPPPAAALLGGILALSAPSLSPGCCLLALLALFSSTYICRPPPCPCARAFQPQCCLQRHLTGFHLPPSSSASIYVRALH